MSVSVIIPLFNEIERLPKLHEHLQQFDFAEVIFVDGGSNDGSWQWLREHSQKTQFKNIQVQSGRAKQMNAGAAKATGELLLFLHADTLLTEGVEKELSMMVDKGLSWGRFDIQFSETDWRMCIIAFFINVRSRLSSIATGDQGLFVVTAVFEKLGAYADIPLMEDVELSKRLKQYSRPYCSRLKIKTSARRWLVGGIFKTVCQMWWFRFAYYVGVNPQRLAKQYHNTR